VAALGRHRGLPLPGQRKAAPMPSPLISALKRVKAAFGGSGIGRIPPVRWLYDLAFRLLKPSQVTVLGHKMRLDDRDTLELSTRGIYEPGVTRLFQREIRPGDLVLDIGANIGYFTLLAARLAGNSGKVLAFEPDPTNFGLLSRNVADNGYKNVSPRQEAVADKAGTLRLYLSASNRGDHRLFDPGDSRESIEVRTVALDQALKGLDRKVRFIKMDVQGAEALALAGMKGLLGSNRGLKLVTEFEPKNLELAGSDPRRFLVSLKKAGFKLWEIPESGPLKPAEAGSLLKRCQTPPGYVNLYCVKG